MYVHAPVSHWLRLHVVKYSEYEEKVFYIRKRKINNQYPDHIRDIQVHINVVIGLLHPEHVNQLPLPTTVLWYRRTCPYIHPLEINSHLI